MDGEAKNETGNAEETERSKKTEEFEEKEERKLVFAPRRRGGKWVKSCRFLRSCALKRLNES